MDKEEIIKNLSNIKEKEPLIYCITNFVTASDMAQVLTSIGARPLMANSPKESYDIAKVSDCLLINIGTLDDVQKDGMINAYKSALENNVPIIIDPVGIHATKYRKDFIEKLLNLGNPTLIKGNLSEIKALLNIESRFKGIDCLEQENSFNNDIIKKINTFSKDRNIIIVVSGKIDLVIFKDKTYYIKNGSPLMSKVTGTGCFLGAILGSFLGSCKNENDEKFYATIAGISFWGICGQDAENEMKNNQGLFTYKHKMLDNISKVSIMDLREKVDFYEIL